MANVIATYGCTILPTKNNVAKMKPNANGAYRMILGGFNIENGNGKYYPYTEKVKSLFAPGSILRHRCDNGYLKPEYNHPDLTGLSHIECLKRLAHTDLTKQAAYITAIEIVESKDDKGRPVVLVVGWVKPGGPYGKYLQEQLDEPEANCAFSVRSFSTRGLYNGRAAALVTDILGWDVVGEPGILMANQFMTATLESANHVRYAQNVISMHERAFTVNDFNDAIKDGQQHSMESDDLSKLIMVRDGMGGWAKTQSISSLNWR